MLNLATSLIEGLEAVRLELVALRTLVGTVVLNAGELQQVQEGVSRVAAKLDPLVPTAKELHLGIMDAETAPAADPDEDDLDDAEGDEGAADPNAKEPADFPVARETQTVGPGDVGTLSGAELMAGGGLPANAPDNEQGSAPPQGDNANDSGNGQGSGSGSQDQAAESSSAQGSGEGSGSQGTGSSGVS